MSTFNQWLLGIGGTITILVLLVVGLSKLRDEFVYQGWLKESNRLAKMTRRAEVSRFRGLVTALGIDATTAAEVREVTSRRNRHYRQIPAEVQRRPDVSFLIRASTWVRELEAPFDFQGSRYVLDIMGAIHHQQPGESSLEQIFHSWIRQLKTSGRIPEFDVVLGIKDGNPLLSAAVARELDIPLVLCKSINDKATVSRGDARDPHETDFEGLRAASDRYGAGGRVLRPLIVDDSCSRGSQIVSAAQRFNRWISDQATPGFSTVDAAVVLFRFMRPAGGVDAIASQRMALHALVSVGEPELKLLREGRLAESLKKDPLCLAFKKDRDGCASSRDLFSIPSIPA